MTRRLQFGLKDEKAEDKAEKKRNRKRKTTTKESEPKKKKSKKHGGKGKGKLSKSKVSAKKVKAKGSKRLQVLREVKAKSPQKQVPTGSESSHPEPPCPASVDDSKPEEKASSSIDTKKVVEPLSSKPKGNSRKKSSSKKSKDDKDVKEVAVVPQEVIDSYTEQIEKGLSTCCDQGCEYAWDEDFTDVGDCQYQLSTYWSRNAVGVKVSNELLDAKPKKNQDKKVPKSKNFSQIGYFASAGCIYLNLVMAKASAL